MTNRDQESIADRLQKLEERVARLEGQMASVESGLQQLTAYVRGGMFSDLSRRG